MLNGREIVCVGFAEWDTELWTNQHHLMSRLAADNNVLFIESLGLRRPQLRAGRDLRRIGRRLAAGLRGPRITPEGVRVLSPLVLPLHSSSAVRWLNGVLLSRLVGRAARGMTRPVLWAYVPQAEALLDVLDPSLVIYHCVDDIAVQDGVDFESFRACEKRFAVRADLILCSSPALAERLSAFSDEVMLAANVADTAAFASALQDGPIDPGLAALPRPRLLFTGAIAAKKLDLELLAGVARARPDWSLALVGPVGLGDPSTDVAALAALPNVHLLGARPHGELPTVLRGADAALIPYRRTELTASIFPMKVYEYLAAGLPVVSTPLPALRGVDAIEVAGDVPATVAALERLMSSDGPGPRAARSAGAATHSWDVRLEEIAAAVARVEGRDDDGRGERALDHPDRLDPVTGTLGLGTGRTLFVSTFAPTLGSGRALRTWTIVRALAEFGPVDFAYVPFGAEEPSPEYLDVDGLAFHVIRPSRGARRATRFAALLLTGVPEGPSRAVSPELISETTHLAQVPGRGLVVAGDFSAMVAMRGLARRRAVAFVSHNVESSFRPAGRLERRTLRATERRLLGLAAESWMVSDRDIEIARELAPRARLRYVPNAVDTRAIQPVVHALGTQTVLMVGDFSYEPNRAGARWLMDQVMPHVWQRLPGARLCLTGGSTGDIAVPDERIEVTGYVEDLRARYSQASAVAVPLLEGGGTPLKFIEALAYGVPVVATPVAAQGLHVSAGQHFRLASAADPAGFAAELVVLLLDGDDAMAARARALVEQEYSVQSVVRLLEA